MDIVTFSPDHLDAAAALFVAQFKALRAEVPALPDAMASEDHVAGHIARIMGTCEGVAAVEDGRLAGYMGWYIVEGFRDTERKTAYCPEWAHAAGGDRPAVYRALYRAAAAQWTAAGCHAHAVTYLARDPELEQIWYWNGFGLTVVDAVRPLQPLALTRALGIDVRKATGADAEILCELDAEHRRHYSAPPTLMAPRARRDAAGWVEFVREPKNAVWLAFAGGVPAGLMMFEGSSEGAADIVNAETTIAITGAYVRPAYRGRRAAPALLDAAQRDYTGRGFERCAVDFESFNPEAAAFWVKYFEPVALSAIRVPEAGL